MRGNAISGTDMNIGTNRFLNPLIKEGIRKKKIMTNPWAVVKQLKK
jgi:hypothetical protein